MNTRKIVLWATGAAAAIGLTVIAVSTIRAQAAQDQGTPAQAGPRRPGPGGRGFGPGGGPFGGFLMPRVPNLTEDQRKEMRAIADRHQSEVQPVMEQLRNAQSALDEAIAANPTDEATIRLRSADVANAEADLAVLRGRIYSEVLTILTPEQQQQLQEQRSRLRERLQNRPPRR